MMLLTHLVRTGPINSTVPLPNYNCSSYVKYCLEIVEFKKRFMFTYLFRPRLKKIILFTGFVISGKNLPFY